MNPLQLLSHNIFGFSFGPFRNIIAHPCYTYSKFYSVTGLLGSVLVLRLVAGIYTRIAAVSLTLPFNISLSRQTLYALQTMRGTKQQGRCCLREYVPVGFPDWFNIRSFVLCQAVARIQKTHTQYRQITQYIVNKVMTKGYQS